MVTFHLTFGIKDWDDAVAALATQDDRSSAIVAASLLEENILKAIKFHFKQQSSKIEGEFMKGYGPLASFRSRIDLGFFMGFYHEQCHQTLIKIKDIRNRFAHRIKPHSFETQEIKDLLQHVPSIESIISCWENMNVASTNNRFQKLVDELKRYPNNGRGHYMCYIQHRCMSLVGWQYNAPESSKRFIFENHC